jgi:two-component system response regulator MprA
MRVLVVDDDADTRDVLQGTLQDEGYATDEAADGVTALQALCQAPEPHVVVLDHFLPGLTGLDLLARVPAEPCLARHRYLLLTASPDRVPHAALGPATLLPKPFDLEELLAAVEAAARRIA